jgi:uncharacterized protein
MSGILDLLVPKEKKFFELLNQQASILKETVFSLNKTIVSSKEIGDLQAAIAATQKARQEVETLTKETVHALHHFFITPIDRHEILAFATTLDRLGSSAVKMVKEIDHSQLRQLDPFFIQIFGLWVQMIGVLPEIFENPLAPANHQRIQILIELEKQADEIYGKAKAGLFRDHTDPIEILKLKELYDIAENSVDDVKTIADQLESILINHS